GRYTVQALSLPSYVLRFFLNVLTRPVGNKRWASRSAMMTGKLCEALSAFSSSTGISANAAATSISILRCLRTTVKYGVLLTDGSTTLYLWGSAMMFLIACNLGT